MSPAAQHKLVSPFSSLDPSALPPPLMTAQGVPFHPIWQLIPALSPFYTSYEKHFDATASFIFLYRHTWVPLLATALYFAFCYYGPKAMRHRKAFDLKTILCLWNLSLSLISFAGAVRVGTHLLYLLSPWGGFSFRDTICESPEATYADNATGLWCVVFTVSKLLELVDTIFVVLRKKPLIFLHWYHHATVLLCSWFGHVTFTPALYFMAINYSIHGVMYMYFFLMAIKKVPQWFNPMWLTVAQISQMFVGIWVIVMSCYYKYFEGAQGEGMGKGCAIDGRMIVAICLMYSTYLVLFVKFFVQRYAGQQKRKGAREVAVVGKEDKATMTDRKRHMELNILASDREEVKDEFRVKKE
ncbi:fatty-acyl elongase [Nannochloropsis oceanica]|uniref:Elongation of fatty acids protein n=1 Tax=Nannochloropsis sp. TaxID=52230 RepID=A0A286QY53_9STRA|nr:long-chain fatty acid elongase [Nannochloropsis sp.]